MLKVDLIIIYTPVYNFPISDYTKSHEMVLQKLAKHIQLVATILNKCIAQSIQQHTIITIEIQGIIFF